MPATTPNFGFTYPLDTDPLADGAGDIQAFATTADTTFADLKGGTTDQYLAKNSNTDMDFKWVTFTPPAEAFPQAWVFNDTDTTAAATRQVFNSGPDTFTTEAATRYYFKGQILFEKAGTSGSITLDLNFSGTVTIDWSYATYVSAGGGLNRASGAVNTDSTQVTAVTASTVLYSIQFEGVFETEGIRTFTPQMIASAGTVDLKTGGTWMCVTKLGSDSSNTYGTGWSA